MRWESADVSPTDLECLKSKLGQLVEIVTQDGERLLIKPIFVFDNESEPDLFFWDVTSDPTKSDMEQTEGYRISLFEIVSVRPYGEQ